MLKLKYVVFVALLLSAVLIISSCGRKGSLNPNLKPTIEITSYGGVENPTMIDSTNSISFQQKIYWWAEDEDGVVDQFAYRILDENGNPLQDEDGLTIGVPGNTVVDDEGWVYHYQPGADESIPLAETEARTIWTDEVYAIINFPANANGDSIPVTSIFEVKCKDNRDEECETPARKYYYASSRVPECNIGSSKGDINGATIGTGIVFTFNIQDEDQFVGNEPYYFKFRFEKQDKLGNVIPESEGGYNDSLWWDTKDQDNVGEYFVSLDDAGGTQPAMKLNTIENGVVKDSTYLYARAIDLAGIVSEVDTVAFVVKEGFYPSTLIYSGLKYAGKSTTNDIMVLGRNHYTTYNPVSRIIPSIFTSSGYQYSSPFWVNKNGDFTCFYSNDLKIYMHWGYNGEYEQNNPNLKGIEKVYDEQTSTQYFSAIKFYDLRLDGEPYNYPPLPGSVYNFTDPETGKEWLRVPIQEDIAKKTILAGLEPGVHRFEVRAVDLQNEPDQTPAEIEFEIVETISAEEKEGILVLDDTPANDNFSPEALIDSLYSKMGFFEDYPGRVDQLDRKELSETTWIDIHWSRDVFSPTDLQEYKTVIYHADYPNEKINFALEYDVMELYLQGGGNLILSGGANLDFELQTALINSSFPILQKYFGIDYEEEDAIVAFATKWVDIQLKRYFINAQPAIASFDTLFILQPHFNDKVEYNVLTQDSTLSIAPVAYFPEEYLSENTEVLYRFGCKEAGDDPLSPSDAEYDYLSQQPVAIKNVTNIGNKCYIFGFPLSYMDTEDVSDMLMQIIAEIEE